ncbi:MAG: hypothetical protein K8R75_00775 [Deltaproteobacteria bacterium]|nr:hypothetical protein [Deltaproteobacteria bacterium]
MDDETIIENKIKVISIWKWFIVSEDNGYWTKFKASRVTPTPQIPHDEFESASRLIEDFWKDVEEILK